MLFQKSNLFLGKACGVGLDCVVQILGAAAVGGLSLLEEKSRSQAALIGGVDALLAEAHCGLGAAGNGLGNYMKQKRENTEKSIL